MEKLVLTETELAERGGQPHDLAQLELRRGPFHPLSE